MINTIYFKAEQKIKRDGKEIIVPAPPDIALENQGAQIMVTITQPKSVIDKLPQSNGTKRVSSLQCKALIDTGSFGCVITPTVAETLKLVQTGYKKINSVLDEKERPAYYASIHFHWGKNKDVSVVECPLKGGFDCIIGRDILMHWNFIYNGRDGYIVICD